MLFSFCVGARFDSVALGCDYFLTAMPSVKDLWPLLKKATDYKGYNASLRQFEGKILADDASVTIWQALHNPSNKDELAIVGLNLIISKLIYSFKELIINKNRH